MSVGELERALRAGIPAERILFAGVGKTEMELRAALNKLGMSIPMVNFIDGLSGADITPEHIEKAVDVTRRAATGEPYQEVNWLILE